MRQNRQTAVRDVLTGYLEAGNFRKTPERYAILDAAYSFSTYFTIEEISTRLAEENFQVSRATLYNTMRLLIELRLVIRHHFQKETKYEACYASESHCLQICTICGKVSDIDIPEISEALSKTKFRRFRRECYSLYVYGVCSTCHLRMNRSSKVANENVKK